MAASRPRTTPGGAAAQEAPGEQLTLPGFQLALGNFEGPFDLLLQLIGAKKLDVTEIALAEVTDEFIAYTRDLGATADLDEITEFLVIAATLLDLKTARLLPRGEVDDEEDLALLESRDILFAKLLQYQAYKKAAEQFAAWQVAARRRYPRAVSLEPQFAQLLPPVRLGMDAQSFAEFAASVFRPRPPEEVATGHIHQVAVSVPEQAGKLLDALRLAGAETWLSFAQLTSDCGRNMEIVGRFLALLELFKAKAVSLKQEESLGPLDVSWTGIEVDPAVVAAANWE
ncbi:segregation/condensation protein A [Corynebacterium sp. 13CS0277]|uniref:segregation and condensation protein A n=1 Tax=Corynebacterium sp. 13CS0277 TaxID=2071994 RepID=UPI000D029C00|nr:segregation/condensation protein A [Corynebacterium sp. 13CS0277]PRQ12016.1 segregation/condensation protein A [Corynebacterium sp. 13CS0277]